MKNIIIMFLLLVGLNLSAQEEHQEIKGKVILKTVKLQKPLAGAFIHWNGESSGIFTNDKGEFIIHRDNGNNKLIASFASYSSDTIIISKPDSIYTLFLSEENNLNTAIVVARRISYGLSKLSPRTTIVLGEREFQKAACCNLSESFENAPAIDVSFSDAVTGTKQIKMLGLDGFYTLIGREYMPSVRTLNSYYGLSHIPAAWVDGIQITKGAGSVVNGHESIAGQINVELKKPFGKEKLILDQFASSGGRFETDFMYAKDISNRIATSLLVRYGQRSLEFDRNKDGFLDMPKSEDFKIMNRWQFFAENGLEGTANVSYHNSLQKAGQTNAFNANPNPYEIGINTEVIDFFAKLGKASKKNEYSSFGSQYNLNHSEMTSTYGSSENLKQYVAQTNQGYVNLLYESIIGNSFHQFQTGISFLIDETQETYEGFRFERTEAVSGLFFEYTYKPKETFSLVGGIRTDYNTIYGLYFTPRFHGKYRFNNDKTSIRTSMGLGRRTSNPLAQNQMLFASGRKLEFRMSNSQLAYGLEQEYALNSGISFEHKFKITYMPATIGVDYFNTTFINEVVMDRENAGKAYFYNVKNGTVANSIQTQLDLEPARRTTIRIAYRMFDVQSKYQDENNLSNFTTRQKPFISKHRSFINFTQGTRNDWRFNTTLTWYGPQRIAGAKDTSFSNGVFMYDIKDKFSPNFILLNAQVSKIIKKEFEVYIGAENILNYRQQNPIQNAFNPYSENFDAGLVWGPIFGRIFYGGFRWRIKSSKK
ncbi:MAG: Vitamin B12 transporter BtuB [Bacteroidia bacterium]|nr:MAG: Vitamin B12 transporter BtuB [Bacteroidia bacterium]